MHGIYGSFGIFHGISVNFMYIYVSKHIFVYMYITSVMSYIYMSS